MTVPVEVAKTIVGYPPNYKEIAARFEVPKYAIFAWGDTIFNPSGRHISQDLIAHETVHMVQQSLLDGPEAWWRRYLDEPGFRIDQEAKAYGRQYQYICSQNPNRNFQFQVLQALALTLASPMYGSATTQGEAMRLIRSNS